MRVPDFIQISPVAKSPPAPMRNGLSVLFAYVTVKVVLRVPFTYTSHVLADELADLERQNARWTQVFAITVCMAFVL